MQCLHLQGQCWHFEVKEGRAAYGKRTKSKKLEFRIRQDLHDRQEGKEKKS